jgi:hypothetical protein
VAVTQNGHIGINLKSTLADVGDLSVVRDELAKLWEFVFLHGIGANQATQLWHATRTLAASADEDLDFGGGIGSPPAPLLNALGQTVTLTRVKALFVKAAAANTNAVVVSQPAANGIPLFQAAGDGLPVEPGGCLL